jgi:hypothetical protein
VVTLAQLRDLDVPSWVTSANEWNDTAGKLLDAARDFKAHVLAPLGGTAWTGAAGEQAKQRLQGQLDRLVVDSLECKAVAYLVHGLAHAFQLAQNSLRSALAQARAGDFTVDDAGTVHLPTSPMVRHDPEYGDYCYHERQRLEYLVEQALLAATRADHSGHDALDRLAGRTGVTSVDEAENGDLGFASKAEVDLLAGTVPTGNRDQIAAWWASLSDEDRRLLKLAVPWQLENLDGIPDEVKKELKGSDGYDRTGVAKWALDHWNDNSDDPFKDNCTNFASNALQGGGLPMHNEPFRVRVRLRAVIDPV